ncbi:C4-dicarboxylate ABC transporter [Intrasporangium oryzae NRRL B-24470]|uniref:C4-dicarboxylate ABC transporter n=1 Tax=Intrasporangium oryzae NRRL B-24470 TaxID=1386089 RepID=W9G904_9MICO|nr:anaerobic C4-dicarboxylate transporter family protein [Intrasporangium oryzae]EWT02671.1 C4-dicarboxylate ABC transporter [Intrasporangium oryzae NRRL B-24470]
MSVSFVLEALVVLGAIVMGTRAGGVGVGLWGGLGTFVLVFIFGEPPGEPPAAAMAIILAVVLAASMMQASGGIDWMVAVAAKVIERHPKQITLIAPLTAFAFSIGAGTSNIIYPLLPVIYDVSYKNHIRPSRPLTVTVVQSGMALAASPVSAAMAAMLTLTDVEPYNLGLTQILAITIPSCIIGIVVTSLIVNRMWKDLDEDPEVQARIASGVLAAPTAAAAAMPATVAVGGPASSNTPASGSGSGSAGAGGTGAGETGTEGTVAPGPSASSQLTYTAAGRNSALVFLLGVVVIVLLGLFPDLRPSFEVEGEGAVAIDMTTTIVLVMFVVGTLILFVGRPDVKTVPDMSVFKAGMVSAIALFGIAWLTATFISAHEEYIVSTVGAWVTDWKFLFALAVFLVAALTTSQSTATRTIVPIGLAAGLPAGVVTGMWAGALSGVYTLPANGTQIAAANFDLSGTTKLGSKLFDHSFFIPMLVMSVVTVAVGALIGGVFF